MRHPTEGTLRRLLDEPDGVTDTERQHVETCDTCGGSLDAMRDDAAHVHAALASDVDDVDLDDAWRRLTAAAATSSSDRSVRIAVPRRRRVRRPVAAAVAVAVVVAGAGAAAANDWLPIFRTERVEPVAISVDDLNTLPDLSAYGDIEIIASPDVHQVASAEAAATETGLDVPEVTDLPQGIIGEPTFRVGGEASASFTFSAARAAQAAADAGEDLPPVPPGLDGTQVRFVAGPGVAQVWSSRAADVPALVVARAVAPAAFSSSDVSFETMRDYLLSIPGLPDDVAEPLRTFNADGATLPLPIPADRVTTSSATVDGMPATVIATPDRTLAAVVWVKDGVLTVVAGALDADEVVSVAQELA
jgi:hypothetical protein